MQNELSSKTIYNGLVKLILAIAFVFILPSASRAQEYFSPSELDTLVSSIALYPDQLLTHVLNASTCGEQIPAANAWAQSHRNLKGESLTSAMESANLGFDASVQALLPFPKVLSMMEKYKPWQEQLGIAVTSQYDDVMEAVQRLRQSAQEHGHLSSNDKVKVERQEKRIVIVPVQTEYVYVPIYNPHVVYYQYADGYTRVTYSSGIWLGAWHGYWYRPHPRHRRPPHHGHPVRPSPRPQNIHHKVPAHSSVATPPSRAQERNEERIIYRPVNRQEQPAASDPNKEKYPIGNIRVKNSRETSQPSHIRGSDNYGNSRNNDRGRQNGGFGGSLRR